MLSNAEVLLHRGEEQLGSREFEGAFTRDVNDCASGSTFLTQCIVTNVAIIVVLNECPALISCHVVGRKTTNVQSLTLRVNGSLQFSYCSRRNHQPGSRCPYHESLGTRVHLTWLTGGLQYSVVKLSVHVRASHLDENCDVHVNRKIPKFIVHWKTSTLNGNDTYSFVSCCTGRIKTNCINYHEKKPTYDWLLQSWHDNNTAMTSSRTRKLRFAWCSYDVRTKTQTEVQAQ